MRPKFFVLGATALAGAALAVVFAVQPSGSDDQGSSRSEDVVTRGLGGLPSSHACTPAFDEGGLESGKVALHKDVGFVSPRPSFQSLCLTANEQSSHLGSQGFDDVVSSVENRTDRTICLYADPNFTGATVEVNPQSDLNLIGHYARYNDILTSVRAC
ncbi:peptidase inhibitor family I36 protein [Streptomyces globisporus]|uniref:peptidase inhibitor family I36 protein n=1 Tax=Streptomyces globisporus TaxID=1908 RepID=UPI00381AA8DA